jgi:hypothetical protein
MATMAPEFGYFCFHANAIALPKYPAEVGYRTSKAGFTEGAPRPCSDPSQDLPEVHVHNIVLTDLTTGPSAPA